MKKMGKYILFFSVIGFALTSCAPVGAYYLVSAEEESSAVGSVLGGTLEGIANKAIEQAIKQAIESNKPVQYSNGNQKIEAIPEGTNNNGCEEVIIKYYKNNKLVKTETKKICNNNQVKNHK